MNRELAEEFLAENKLTGNTFPLTNGKLFAYGEMIGKSLREFSEEDFICFFFDYVKINNISTLNAYRTRLRQFWDWLEKKGLAGENPFRNRVRLDADTLAAYMARRVELCYYDDSLVERVMENLREDEKYTELVIRAFYEGIGGVQELAYLRRDQLDFGRGEIRLGNRRMLMSPRLSRLLQWICAPEAAQELSRAGGRGLTYQRLCQEDALVFPCSRDSERNRKQYLQRKLERVQRELKLPGFTARRLYLSGLLQYLYKACGQDQERFVNLLSGHKGKHENRELQEIVAGSWYPVDPIRLRHMFRPYLLQVGENQQ